MWWSAAQSRRLHATRPSIIEEEKKLKTLGKSVFGVDGGNVFGYNVIV